MHKAKTSFVPKFITSLLAVLALVLGGSLTVIAPASAISWSACTNSAQHYNDCQASTDITMTLTPATYAVAPASLAAGSLSQAQLYNAGVALNATTCAVAYGYAIAVKGTSTIIPSGWTVSVNATTGLISVAAGSATPAAGTYVYEVTGTCQVDANVTVTRVLDFTVLLTSAKTLTPATQTVSATQNSAITSTSALTATNFTAAPIYSVSPALPAGLSLNTSTGVISGTPTGSQGSTNYTIIGTYLTETATVTVAISVAAVQAAAVEPPPPSRKVTICHRTHAVTNPYVRITVDYNAVNKKSGHQGHDEIFAGQHVFTAGIYTRAKDKLWGDIIPADPSGLNRWQPLNWTTLGAQIYNGTVEGCPSYDPVAYYNSQREAGVPEAKLKKEMADLEAELQEGNPGTKRVDPTTLKYSGKDPVVTEQDNDKVTICHRTHATTNPYVRITVSTSSVTNPAGHYSHDEIYSGHHVFDSSVNYPNNQKLWGDIIPADPTGKNRWQPLNWTALGESIYNGTTAGCGEQTLQQTYDKLRESGLTKKQVLDELEKEKNIDEDPKDIDELEYKGEDPKIKEKEPKVPTDPGTSPTQSLSGIIWLDRNKDGMKDPDEPYLPGVEITLVPADGSPSVKIKTDPNGYFEFPSLNPGDYKVITTIPTDLAVTYDSEGLNQGEMNATVPSGGKAFTWAGLVGTSEVVDKKTMEVLLTNNPSAIPLEEVPTWLRAKVQSLLGEKYKKPVTGVKLAATGGNELAGLLAGFALLIAAAGLIALRRKVRN